MLAPALGIFVLSAAPEVLRRPRLLAGALLAFLVGLAVYVFIPIRAATDPPVNIRVPPTTWDAFWDYVLAREFRSDMGFLTPEGPGRALAALPSFVHSLEQSIGAGGLVLLMLLAAVGWVAVVRRDRRVALFVTLALVIPLYVALGYSNSDIERYYFSTLALLAALGAVGATVLLQPAPAAVRRWPALGAIPALALGLPLALVPLNLDRVANLSAGCFVDAAAGTLRPGAIVMSSWNPSTPLRYLRFVDGRRPDIEVFTGLTEVPPELDRRFGEGRPIYLIQPESQIEGLASRYRFEKLELCGETVWAVAGRQGA
jgi:hypothetical protein